MPENNFGSGIKLTETWDLEIDNTGDIASSSGTEELQKDIAVVMATVMNRQIGTRIPAMDGPNSKKAIEMLAENTLLSDARIEEVTNVEVTMSPHQDMIALDCDVIADNGERELVFEVDL